MNQRGFAIVARMKPTGLARSGRPDDRLREIRGTIADVSALPGLRCAYPGYVCFVIAGLDPAIHTAGMHSK
jgi:hypothetical protein